MKTLTFFEKLTISIVLIVLVVVIIVAKTESMKMLKSKCLHKVLLVIIVIDIVCSIDDSIDHGHSEA